MKYILLLLICVAINSCGIVKNQGWKLQRMGSNEVTSTMVDFENYPATKDQSFSDVAQVELRSNSTEKLTEIHPPVSLSIVEKEPSTNSTNCRPTALKETKSVFPKKERTELEKIQRSFRRQATWFFIFSFISSFITFGLFDIDGIAAAFPFLLITLAGLTAFVLAIRFMVRAKRLKKNGAVFSEADNQSLEHLRHMKKIGFWSLMGAIALGILSVIILIVVI